MIIKFTVFGKPLAQKRPRFFRAGKGIRSYDPDKQDKKDLASVSSNNAPQTPFSTSVMLEVIAYFKRPKSHYRTGKYSHILKDAAPRYHTAKPDWDNIGKSIGDALEGLYWTNDSKIVKGTVEKLYTEEEERMEITITLLNENDQNKQKTG